MCKTCNKAPVRAKRAMRCGPCNKKVRQAQLVRNNVAWHKRLAKGRGGHRLTYRGKLTGWAKASKPAALTLAKKLAAAKDIAPLAVQHAVMAQKLLARL